MRFVRRSAVQTAVSCALTVAGLLGVTNCARQIPTACGGQCSAPYQLQVVFRSGISHEAAQAALTLCSTNPIVIKVGKIQEPGHAADLTVTIYTRTGPSSARTASFLKCLGSKSGILRVGIPS